MQKSPLTHRTPNKQRAFITLIAPPTASITRRENTLYVHDTAQLSLITTSGQTYTLAAPFSTAITQIEAEARAAQRQAQQRQERTAATKAASTAPQTTMTTKTAPTAATSKHHTGKPQK